MEEFRQTIKVILEDDWKLKAAQKLESFCRFDLCKRKSVTSKNQVKKPIHMLGVQQALLPQQLHCESYKMQKMQIQKMCDVFNWIKYQSWEQRVLFAWLFEIIC